MQEVLDKIKSKGYWRISVHPIVFNEDRISSLSKCEEIIENATIRLRGWPYPLFNHSIRVGRGQDWIQVAEDLKDEIEVWRFYQSGHFIHHLALREDWMDLESIRKRVIPPRKDMEYPVIFLEFIVFTITEIFEFASRLAKQGIYREGAEIEIELTNIEGRKLAILDTMRAGFMQEYKTDAEKLIYPIKKISEKEAINNSRELAMDAILWFVERFDWKNPNIASMKDMQQKLIERRL